MEDSAKLVVAVRIRPISEKELSKDNVEIVTRALDDKVIRNLNLWQTILIVDPMEDWSEDVLRQNRPREKIYAFDQVFSESSSQLHVYERTVRFLIPYVLQGYNSTVFAYGKFRSHFSAS
jgi:kinesin family protein 18/19